MPEGVVLFDNAGNAVLPAASALSDALGNPTTPVIGAAGLVWNPATSAWERVRTPTIYKHVAATVSGNTALWTPAAGKKFRILGYTITVTGGATLGAAANQIIKLLDGATDLNLTHYAYVPAAVAAAPTGSLYNSGLIRLGGNGILSAAANNVLNVNNGTVYTAGGSIVDVFGTEE